jgi:RNA polymerase sigma-70 factor (ECF subfamily)
LSPRFFQSRTGESTDPAVATPPDNAAIIEEACLIARAGAGDREAFRQLYARYSTPLYSMAVRFMGDAGDAEEVLQDAFLKLWMHASSYDSRKSRPFTWAVTILRRTCIDHLRRRRRLPETAPLATGDAEHSSPESVRNAAEAREDSERLRGALADVPPRQRHALELALFSELTQAEIAQRLEQPVGTVKSWIRRGMLGLRSTLNNPE